MQPQSDFKSPNGDLISAQEGADDKEAAPERGTWSNAVEFVLSCLGYAVGLGNVWRFPSIVYRNGGGAFLIPYVIMLLFVGIPSFFIELLVGQYSGCGPLTIWSAVPLFKGIGVGMILITSMLSTFYTMLLGYSLYYLVVSFQKDLPWDHCQHSYNTPYCYTKSEAEDCEDDLNGTWFNQTCYNGTFLGKMDSVQKSGLMNMTEKTVSSSEEYLNLGVLEVSAGIEHTDGIKWELVVALACAWFLCFLCVIKGIKTSGKVVYFTAVFPYVILLILLIRALTLPGAYKGVEYFITPKWEKLKDEQVWADAAGQVFFSLSVGGGGLMTFASYNKFNNNIYRDTLIVGFGNSLTSIFAGFVIFSILGYMAHIMDRDVGDVVTAGAGLAFVAYPTVVSQLPISQLWALIFFLMLITLGLDSLFAGIEVVITAIADVYPQSRKYKPITAFFICMFYFCCGLTLTTRAGYYWLDLISYYGTGWSLAVIGLIEVVVFAWIFGAKKLMDMVKEMTGVKLNYHWWFCWKFLTPALLVVVLIFNIRDFKPLEYGPYTMPNWAQALGWLMTLSPLIVVLIGIIIQLARTCSNPEFSGLTFGQRIVKLCKPSKDWKANKCRPEDKNSTAGMNGHVTEENDYPTKRSDDVTNTSPGDDIAVHSISRSVSPPPPIQSANYSTPTSYNNSRNWDVSKQGNNVTVVEVGYNNPGFNQI